MADVKGLLGGSKNEVEFGGKGCGVKSCDFMVTSYRVFVGGAIAVIGMVRYSQMVGVKAVVSCLTGGVAISAIDTAMVCGGWNGYRSSGLVDIFFDND